MFLRQRDVYVHGSEMNQWQAMEPSGPEGAGKLPDLPSDLRDTLKTSRAPSASPT